MARRHRRRHHRRRAARENPIGGWLPWVLGAAAVGGIVLFARSSSAKQISSSSTTTGPAPKPASRAPQTLTISEQVFSDYAKTSKSFDLIPGDILRITTQKFPNFSPAQPGEAIPLSGGQQLGVATVVANGPGRGVVVLSEIPRGIIGEGVLVNVGS